MISMATSRFSFRLPQHLIHRIYPCTTFISKSYVSSFTPSAKTGTMRPKNAVLSGREIDLLETNDIRFRLPGNVGIFINDDWLLKFKTFNEEPITEELTMSSMIDQHIFAPITREELLNQLQDDKAMPNTESFFQEDRRNLHCEAYDCPLLLVKDFQELFPRIALNLSRGLTVLTITHKTQNDMSSWSSEVFEEREQLLDTFIGTAERMCCYLREQGYWADFIDPSSGRPFYGEYTPATFFETDERYRHFGFEIEDLGCCKVVSHKRWGTNAFVGALFTNASLNSDAVQALVVSLDE